MSFSHYISFFSLLLSQILCLTSELKNPNLFTTLTLSFKDCLDLRFFSEFFFELNYGWKWRPVISLVYPLYASIKAIETKSPIDDQQWLTYWILYSMITLFELTFAKLIEWIPIWSYAKLIATCWLVIPYFNGAAYVYEHFVRPTFVNAQNRTVNIWYVPRKKDIFSKKDDIITAAEKYIQENGTDAFRDLIDKAEYRGTKPKTDYGIFENEYHY